MEEISFPVDRMNIVDEHCSLVLTGVVLKRKKFSQN